MREIVTRVALGILALTSLELGVWAEFAPHSFYSTFPGGGRAWVAVDGAYNQHLVRDFGGLNLALAVILTSAAVTLAVTLVRAAAGGYLFFAVPHLVYHIAHRGLYSTGDQVANLASLSLAVLLALVALALSRSPRPTGASAVAAVRA